MPTRITLKQERQQSAVVSEPRLFRGSKAAAAVVDVLHPGTGNSSDRSDLRSGGPAAAAAPAGYYRRELPAFRSSILRELSVRGGENSNNSSSNDAFGRTEQQPQQQQLPPQSPRSHLLQQLQQQQVVDDIRASPRLLGYLFSTVAGAVMLVSVVQFYRQRSGAPAELDPSIDPNQYYYFFGGVVLRWKLWGAIYLSSAGVFISGMTVVLHFDDILAPRLWSSLFRDGSLAERNWIWSMIVFWAACVHVCTGTLSVGESQANVFFTTWIAFAAAAMNYGVWRESAGLPPLAVESNRETTYNWMWIWVFSALFAGSATDMYYNRENIVLRYRGQPLDLVHKDWIIILSVVWSETALCLIAIYLNERMETSCRLPCYVRRSTGTYRCVLGWRQWEGFVLLVATACKFWVILKYASVDGVIPGLSNAYFGVWGSFFNGVFCLGTWLRENKNIEYVVREDRDDANIDGSRGRRQKNGNQGRKRSKNRSRRNGRDQRQSRNKSREKDRQNS
jgi:hypothetical protein